MRYIIISIFMAVLLFGQDSYAATKAKSEAVSMASYVQGSLDSNGTIALKNNTDEDIRNVTFILEYLDMQGNPMDYETFSLNIDIAPGMTKKIDVPAYEGERHYRYYKDKEDLGFPAFKINYELKSYNDNKEAVRGPICIGTAQEDHDSDDTFKATLLVIIITVVLLSIYIGMYVLVAVMAQRRNRNPAIWLLLSFLATPFLICIILLAVGKDYNSIR